MQLILTLSILSVYSVVIYESFIKIKNSKYKNAYLCFFLIIFSAQSYYNFNNFFLQIKSNQETLNLSFNDDSIKKLNNIVDDETYIIFNKNNSDLSVFKSIYYKFLVEGFNNKNVLIGNLINENIKDKILNENFYLILPSPIINNNLNYKEKKPNCNDIKSIQNCIQRGLYGLSRANMSDLIFRDNDIIQIKSEKKIDKLLININTYDSNLILNNNDEKNDILINSNNKFEWVEINYLV